MEPIIVRGAGDVATGIIYTLCQAGYPVIAIDIERPSAIRRTVSFCQAVYSGSTQVEDLICRKARNFEEAVTISLTGCPALLIGTTIDCLEGYHPRFLIDAILAKRNTGTTRDMADVVIGIGPGFTAGEDVDYVIETQRGHDLGRVITQGSAIPNTGIPGIIGGYGKERVMHSPCSGTIRNLYEIGDFVEKGDVLALVQSEQGEVPVEASLTGVLRGLIMDGFSVTKGLKIADIDPRRDEKKNCYSISDKARTIGGGVLTVVVREMNCK